MSKSVAGRPLALIGARGSGKTTVARALASRLHWKVVDLDDVIEQTAGKTIAEIFATSGESKFRQLESQALKDALADRLKGDAPASILSLGGGAVLAEANQTLLRELAATVLLQAKPETLLKRVEQDAATDQRRPALTDLDFESEMRQVLHARTPIYESLADLIVDTENKSPEAIAEEIITWLSGLES